MPRYVDADKFRDWILKQKRLSKHYTVQMLDETPSADVEEVRHGEWVFTGMYDAHYNPIFECTNCHREVADGFIKNHSYCLHCGAKMIRCIPEEVG